MKLISLDSVPFEPVSHDPTLKKQVLAGEGILRGIRNVSHIVLKPGSRVEGHSHDLGSEVFYFIRGRLSVEVAGRRIEISPGMLLIVEPYETHSFDHIEEETEMLYFFVNKA